ncbi:CubicO group peptidase (beta-lactamase class C family) [Algisphaera agarilytica]|uniref:CubicO group peptidase (Beta-lactamase class C family) n=2 Tax=Algisphaera agarilytica TaxID=1385975 RepID=A0A7X0LKR8_9BACT|nr:CubicO group peptidase (beta-lactamase class C family) [Algisphaera agarilytica]
MPRDAIFRLQSMSKPVVTVAALVLHEAGEFDLDEPIAKHLPEWAEPKVLVEGELVPAHTAITPRMLMSHSSGLYYGTLPGYPKPRSRPTDLEANSKLLATFPLKFHPGAGYSYGTSIDVLGRYCEVVAGKPLDEVFRERVLAPLHMDETDFWVPEDKADRIAQVYTQSSPGELKRGREASRLTRKPTLFLGGQGLCSTAEDYEKFCLMLLNGGTLNGVRVLSEKTVDDIFTNQLADIGERYGLGGSVDGDGGYAWGGANGTQFWIDRPNNMIGIFMVQTQRYRAPTFNRFRSLAWEAITDEPQPDTTDGPVGKAVDPALRWTRSLQLPLIDDGGHRLTGTEVMELAAFRGALYAGNSQWNAKNDHRPTQVFTLKGLDQSWQLDFELPEVYTRTTYLQTFTFRTDGNGDAIEPRSVLLLGVNRQRVRGAKTPAVVFVKDDQTDAWVEHTIGLSDTEKWAVGVRSMGFHRDKVTGADKVFLGIGPGAGVYSGTWDARDGGSIRWSREPEFKPAAQQRVIGFTVCDDVLYAATQRILYRRHTDGPEPRWETVLEKRASSEFVQNYRDDLHPGWVKYDHFRALGASEYKEGSGEFLLFGSLNRIFRLNPKSDVIEPEINIKKLFKDQLGMDIHYAQAQHYQPVVLADQDQMAIIGLEVMFEDDYIAAHPEVPTSHVLDRHADKKVHWAKQGFYLERRQAVDGTPSYTIREIHDPTHQPQPEWLARVRSVQTSPFPGDTERVIYASGFAPWGLDLRVNDTGWVYRGELQPSAADN